MAVVGILLQYNEATNGRITKIKIKAEYGVLN